MVSRWLSTAVFCVACGLAVATIGCDRPKDPAEVRQDVSAARQESNDEVLAAREEAAKQTADAQREIAEEAEDLGDAKREAAEKVGDANRAVAMARIEGEYEVAKQRCMALTGDARSACENTADAEFEMAKTAIESKFQ